MKRTFIILGTLLSSSLSYAECIQDQYGNQYELTIDAEQNLITGFARSGQGCDISGEPILGSFVGTWATPGAFFEITLFPKKGDSCVEGYKIKGQYPNANWFYSDGTTGSSNQEFSIQACDPTVAPPSAKRGVGTVR